MDRKRSSSPTLATVVFSNEDLLISDLLFVLTRTLIKFQLVNKLWHSIISSEHFSRLHTLHHRHRPTFILCTRPERQYFYFSLVAKAFNQFQFIFPYTEIIQSSHGLLLLECRNKQFGPKSYYIYNPVTNRFRKLSLNFSDGKNKKETVAGLFLILDPSKPVDYKIVCVWRIAYLFQYRVEVFSRRDQSWKSLGKPFIARPLAIFSRGIYWNGGIFWIRPNSTSYMLDLDSGTFGKAPEIRLPRRKKGLRNKNYVMESNGRMHCVAYYWRWGKKFSFLLFEMNVDKSSWFEKYRVDLDPFSFGLLTLGDAFCGDVSVLDIVRGEREEECAVLFHVRRKIIGYWICDGRCEVVLDMVTMSRLPSYGALLFGRGDCHQFIETLVPV